MANRRSPESHNSATFEPAVLIPPADTTPPTKSRVLRRGALSTTPYPKPLRTEKQTVNALVDRLIAKDEKLIQLGGAKTDASAEDRLALERAYQERRIDLQVHGPAVAKSRKKLPEVENFSPEGVLNHDKILLKQESLNHGKSS